MVHIFWLAVSYWYHSWCCSCFNARKVTKSNCVKNYRRAWDTSCCMKWAWLSVSESYNNSWTLTTKSCVGGRGFRRFDRHFVWIILMSLRYNMWCYSSGLPLIFKNTCSLSYKYKYVMLKVYITFMLVNTPCRHKFVKLFHLVGVRENLS